MISEEAVWFLGETHILLLPQQVSWGNYQSFFVKAFVGGVIATYDFPEENKTILEGTL